MTSSHTSRVDFAALLCDVITLQPPHQGEAPDAAEYEDGAADFVGVQGGTEDEVLEQDAHCQVSVLTQS